MIWQSLKCTSTWNVWNLDTMPDFLTSKHHYYSFLSLKILFVWFCHKACMWQTDRQTFQEKTDRHETMRNVASSTETDGLIVIVILDVHSCLKVKYSVRCRHSWFPRSINRVVECRIFSAHKYRTHCNIENTCWQLAGSQCMPKLVNMSWQAQIIQQMICRALTSCESEARDGSGPCCFVLP